MKRKVGCHTGEEWFTKVFSPTRRKRRMTVVSRPLFGAFALMALLSWGAIGVAGADGPIGTTTTTTTATATTTTTTPAPTVGPGSPDVPCCGGGGAVWGVDTVDVITSTFWSSVVSADGTPSVIGRYLVGPYTALSSTEASDIHADGASIVLIDDPSIKTLTSGTNGTNIGDNAATAASDISVPSGTAIYLDVEPSDTTSALFLENWYSAISSGGYTPGFYENSTSGNTSFEGSFCSTNTTVEDGSYLYSQQNQSGSSYAEASAPGTFAPQYRGCESGGQMSGWQYLIGQVTPNVDVDEYATSGVWG
jgi:Rv2525c-like, glycoside hydrolase-like domain